MHDRTPSAPGTHRSLRRRSAWVAAAVVGLIALGTALGEAAGWPFLIAPLENFISSRMHREVSFRVPADGGTAAPRARLHLLGSVRLAASGARIAAPAWSRQGHFLLARDASIELSWPALWRLWRRGSPFEIEHLEARVLDLQTERLADGRTSWYFGDPQGTQRKRRGPPLIRELRLEQGRVAHVDAVKEIRFDATVTTTPDARGSRGLRAQGRGSVKGVPVTAALTVPGVARLSALPDATPGRAIPVLFSLKAGQASLDFQGTIDDILRRQGIRGAFRTDGRSLSAIGDAFGLSLPTTADYRMSGHVVGEGRQRFLLTIDDATIGRSRMKAALVYDRDGKLPSLAGQVSGARLAVVDLLPTIGGRIGAAPAKDAPRRSLPEREFKLQALRAMTADVRLVFDQVELGPSITTPLQSMSALLAMKDGRLTLADVQARLAGGDLRSSASIEAQGDDARVALRLRFKGLRTESWARAARSGEPFLSGAAEGGAELRGHGSSTAEILSRLEGRITTRLRDARISRVVVSAAGGDVSRTLAAWLAGGGSVPVTCAAADLRVAGGVVRPKLLVVDTPDTTLTAGGMLSLRDESLDLRIEARPKRFSPLSLRSPILVRGPLAGPTVSVDRTALSGRVGASVLLGLVNPIAAVLPLVDPGDDDGPVGCGVPPKDPPRAARP